MKLSLLVAALSLTTPSQALAQGVPVLPVTRDLRIDPATADLTGVGVMLVARNGEILVAQSDDQVIRYFSPSGASGKFGHSGEGPGEFRNNWLAGWLADSIWVLDPELRRVSIFSPQHKFVRSFPEPSTVTIGASDSDQPVIELYFQAVYPDGSLMAIAAFPPQAKRPAWAVGADSGTTLEVRISPTGGFRRRIAILPASPCRVNYLIGRGGHGSFLIPFCAERVIGEWGSTSLAFATVEPASSKGASYRVTLIDENGAQVFARSFPFVPRPVSQAARDSSDAARRKSMGRAAPTVLAAQPKVPPATTWPPLRRVVVGRDRTVWLERLTGERDHSWLVLDPKGNLVGTITLPPDITLQVADLNTIWGLETDADGLQGIVRYKVGRARG